MKSFLYLCRPGFEGDLAAELADLVGGYGQASEGQGWVLWHSTQALMGMPIFARTGFEASLSFDDLPREDRVSALLAQLPGRPVSKVFLEHADTNEGRSLQRFLRGFRRPLEQAMKSSRLLHGGADQILHLFFDSSARGWGGFAATSETPWENGLPRLRLLREAPSRSALKLEEAWWRMMTTQERGQWLRDGMKAADLGAAPGGWTWQLARLGIKVTAVDHGRLKESLLNEFPVTHVAADAFTWQPDQRLDWVVCDIVDKPARTLALMSKWLERDWARAALFNLKLPMKHRYRECRTLLERLEQSVPGRPIRASQLYHDREEITVLVPPRGGA